MTETLTPSHNEQGQSMRGRVRPAVKFFVLFLLLAVPSLIYFTVKRSARVVNLPYLGPKETSTSIVNGKQVTDTIYHAVPAFSFTNQHGETITEKNISGKICVADFFFTRCPSICPKMAVQLQRIQKKFRDKGELVLLSHTVDPKHDSISVLKAYAEKAGSMQGIWHLLTGEKKAIYDIARQGYFLATEEGSGSPDDFIHSPMFILLDREQHIRGFYDGTNAEEVDKLIEDIQVLISIYYIKDKRVKK